ncbi:DNA-binding transcriptional regulator [Rickettsiales endosymbiont of Paramecium tredecaurelia]|uniref:response regulator transcription factor n=1 Tax=Candidatus Sarmatiella mevalonica TaxID=2770581 RepID=UPI001922EB0B|nr:response regulator transcription factor [Candidatus Sarmatiella mevalonica]MBL3284613.1 DNA-binding transcriptional regulator [Candidatus Sarmatiella mevalonica]
MIVDDDEYIGLLLQKFFQKHGFLSSIAGNVEDAKELLAECEYDLLMLDVMLPGITGIEFACSIRSKEEHVPIVILTALDDPQIQTKALQSANDYITKPFNSQKLLEKVKLLVQNYYHFKHNKRIAILDKAIYIWDDKTYVSFRDGQRSEASQKAEGEILEYFLMHEGVQVTVEQICEQLDLTHFEVQSAIALIRENIELQEPYFHLKNLSSNVYIFTLA